MRCEAVNAGGRCRLSLGHEQQHERIVYRDVYVDHVVRWAGSDEKAGIIYHGDVNEPEEEDLVGYVRTE